MTYFKASALALMIALPVAGAMAQDTAADLNAAALEALERAGPGDSRTVILGKNGPVITDMTADASTTDAMTQLGVVTKEPADLLKDGDWSGEPVELEPLVLREGVDEGELQQVPVKDVANAQVDTLVETATATAEAQMEVVTNTEASDTIVEVDVDQEVDGTITTLRKRITVMDAKGNRDITETIEVMDGAGNPVPVTIIEKHAGDAHISTADVEQVRIMVVQKTGAAQTVDIDTDGATVTETTTRDGTSRIFRIESDNGDATLVTITKLSSKNDN